MSDMVTNYEIVKQLLEESGILYVDAPNRNIPQKDIFEALVRLTVARGHDSENIHMVPLNEETK